MNVNALDIIFIILITIFIIRCYLKGFISELLTMSALILGILASLFFYKNGGEYLREQFWHGLAVIPEIVAFLDLFFIVFATIKILEILLRGIIERVELSGADRFLGIFFGLAEGIAVISFILFLIRIQPLFDPATILDGSFFAHIILPFITGKENVNGV
jgi:membrane protein required for colicin V production